MQRTVRRTPWIAAGLVALGLLAWLVSSGVERRSAASAPTRDPSSASPPAGELRSPALVEADLARADDEPSEAAVTPVTAVREEVPAETVVIAGRGRPSRTRSIGKLLVRAVDATTDEPLRSFGVRLLNDARFADERTHDASGELELPLTPGTYALVVSAHGYEPTDVARATVAVDQTNRLEPVRLRAGTGVISAEVLGVPRDRLDLAVDLIGAGRRPCERCSDVDDPKAALDAGGVDPWERDTPCPFCGFMQDGSCVRLGAGARAEFRGLASGHYALRVHDGSERVLCEEREVLLPASGFEHVTLELSRERYVELVFLDVDEQSLSDEWRRRLADAGGEPEQEIVSYEGGIRANPFRLAFSDDTNAVVATAVLLPPLPPGAYAFSSGTSFSSRRASASVDRARQPGDLLWPEPARARFDLEVACDVDENGLVRVGPLPSSRLTLLATAENFAAQALVPASRADTRVTLRLRSSVPDSAATPELATYGRYELRGWK